jgi:replicative DNA helicase
MTRRVSSGFATLDTQTGGGLRRGDLVVLGGAAGMGTSSLALGLGLGAAQGGAVTAIITTESRADGITERLLSQLSGLPVQRVRDHVDGVIPRPEIARAERGLQELALHAAVAPVDLAEELHQVAGRGWDLLVVDALEGLITEPVGRDQAAAAWVTRLKRVAVVQNGVVVLTTHTRADSEERPTLAHFGASGAIAAQADLVVGVYREEQYRPDRGVTGAAELTVLKDREGPRVAIDFWFEAGCRRFEDLAEA